MTFVDIALVIAILVLLAWNIALTMRSRIVHDARARRLVRELAADLPKVTSMASEASNLPDAVTRKTRAMLRARAIRLVRVLDLNAPDVLLAWEAALVGDTAWLLFPEAVADRLVTTHAAEARLYAGICTDPSCDKPAAEEGMCVAHAAQHRAELVAISEDIHQDGAS